MKKRITSILLAMMLLLGMVSAGAVDARAESAMTVSDDCIRVLKAEEGFSRTPYWDFTQYTVGYGTTCPSDMVEYYTQNGITEEEAEILLRNHLVALERDINKKIIDKYGLTLQQHQFDALMLFSFNCGTSWAYETGGTFHNAIAQGATGNDLIRAFALWCSAGGQIRTFLLRRRLSEANMYLNGVYSQTPPDNYCYVLYDANGGVTSPRSQGYDANLPATPYPVPTLAGYTFQGWFTAKTGGTKVEVLDASTKGLTLYAQWADGEGNIPPVTGATPENPITVTVTGTEVNLREGPGTNYTRVGSVNKGDQLVITETATGSGYLWGKSEKGWIALQYTDYEAVLNSQIPTTPTETTAPTETTEPTTEETTVPSTEATTAPTTEPTTVPTTAPTTEPTTVPTTAPTTEPTTVPTTAPTTAPTTPPTTAPTEPEKQTVTGTVNVQDWLRVRSGPGTSYSVVGYLKPKEKVEILEQKTVGSMTWGKITSGWISLDYVILDKQPAVDNNTTTSQTGKVTATELLIRSGPGTTYSIVGYLTQGASVTITERKTNGAMEWGKIPNGWISLTYVKLDTTQSGDTTTQQPTDTSITGTVNVQQWLRVRSGPGTSYSVAGYLKPNQKVTITERRTIGSTVWGKIAEGWISLDYVILDQQGTSGGTTQAVMKTIIADCLNVRRGPGTGNTIVGYLYYGAKVEILETAKDSAGDLWGRIATGWIYMGYTR